MKKLVAFDLDGTLAASKQAIDQEIGALLCQLSKAVMVAVISGGDWPQFEQQVVSKLPPETDFERIFLLPTSGTKLYRYQNGWQRAYADVFSVEERALILRSLDRVIGELGFSTDQAWGKKIEDRESQITFSGLGQDAPLDPKKAWDPDFSKRKRLQAALVPLLPGFSVNIGGSTSIDITRAGVDKAYGLRRLADAAKVAVSSMIFVGDALYPGGNDYPVRAAGIETIAVRDVAETKRVIEAIIICMAPAPASPKPISDPDRANAQVKIPEPDLVTHLQIDLRPDMARVVIRPFLPADDQPIANSSGPSRSQRIADRVLGLKDTAFLDESTTILTDLSVRHRDVEHVLMRRFHDVNGLMFDHCAVTPARARLIGAYFSEEYSFEAVALFNPSTVVHPDQTGVPSGSLRFVLSLRGVGEGHISSITFRTGICNADGSITVDPASTQAISPRIEYIPGGVEDDPGVRLICDASHDLSEIVIFPVTRFQRHGIEDLRMVRFLDDDGTPSYLGTYTAFSGGEIRQELLQTTDFKTFELYALRGSATANKGMALFPRRIDGRYAMLGRQDHENIWLLTSDDLYLWETGVKIISPLWGWEFVQIGNCGSPIEIDEGWLVVTHGVGAVRNYCIGACLLDKRDPTKILGRVTLPILKPSADERSGCVPNVIYSCGAMVHNRTLVLPYAVADTFTAFATMPLDRLLSRMA
jgi:HAD superfamily hydrolase (TIGR01484 family)